MQLLLKTREACPAWGRGPEERRVGASSELSPNERPWPLTLPVPRGGGAACLRPQLPPPG